MILRYRKTLKDYADRRSKIPQPRADDSEAWLGLAHGLAVVVVAMVLLAVFI